MTEAEWLAGEEPDQMLHALGEQVGDRKPRLFAVACCHRIWHLLTDERSRQAVMVAERYADGLASRTELIAVLDLANEAYQDGTDAFYGLRTDIYRPHSVAPHAAAMHAAGTKHWRVIGTANSAAHSVFHNIRPFSEADVLVAITPERVAQLLLLRDIFGNPFRPVAVDPGWRTSDVVALARGIYDDRAFDRLPILADALQDAGCDSDDVLDHCRGSGPHVRGCWVVDLVLGKA